MRQTGTSGEVNRLIGHPTPNLRKPPDRALVPITGALSRPCPTETMTPADSDEVPLIRGSITDQPRARRPPPTHRFALGEDLPKYEGGSAQRA